MVLFVILNFPFANFRQYQYRFERGRTREQPANTMTTDSCNFLGLDPKLYRSYKSTDAIRDQKESRIKPIRKESIPEMCGQINDTNSLLMTPQHLEYKEYAMTLNSNEDQRSHQRSHEDQRSHGSKDSRQISRTKRRKKPKETPTGKWMSPAEQRNLARRKAKRRVSLVSVNPHACLETQNFFDAKSKNIMFDLSDMEKPTLAGNTMSGCEDLMSLSELAGLFSMQLTSAMAGSRTCFTD